MSCQFVAFALDLQSKHALKDKSELLYLIRKYPEGIAVIDLKDAYPTVIEDLQVKLFLLFCCPFSFSCILSNISRILVIVQTPILL